MSSLGKKFTGIMEELSLDHTDFFHAGKGTSGYFRKIQDVKGDDDYQYGARIKTLADNPKKLPKGDSPHKNVILEAVEQRFLPVIKETMAYYDEHFTDFATAGAILKTIYVAGLLSYLNENLVKLRQREDILLISDTARILSRSVKSHDAFFIFEKTGNRYSHFLLDEFQDTSNLQWKCMLPLLNNSMSEGKRSLIVGDIKQSIYRWRGGDMRLLQEGVDADLSVYKENILHRNLLTNFRSGEFVVEFNNAFFPVAANLALQEMEDEGKRLLAFAYNPENLKQSVVGSRKGNGSVKINLIRKPNDDDDEENGKWKDISLTRMLDDIRDLKSKGYTYRDICILTYKNIESTEIIAFLRRNGITRLISSEVVNINGSMDVRFVIAMIRFAFDRTDKASEYLIRKFIREAALIPSFADNEEKASDTGAASFRSVLTEIMSLTAYEAVERLMLVFRLSASPDPFLQKLLQLALAYDHDEGHGIYGFLGWISNEIARDSAALRVDLPSEHDSITIMTIHRSKGLEFPVVMLPFMKSKLDGSNKSISWIKPQKKEYSELAAFPIKYSSSLENSYFSEDYRRHRSMFYIDNINVLYVAFTRAAERLYVNVPLSKDISNITSIENLIPNALKNIDGMEVTDNEDVTSYSFGRDEKRATGREDARKSGEMITVDEWQVSSWENRLWGVINHDRISVRDKENDQTKLGRVYHHLMDLYHSGTPDLHMLEQEAVKWLNDPEMISRSVELVKKSISILEKEQLTQEKLNAITEAEILSKDGRLLRPDLLLTSGSKVIVIDYKTGAENETHNFQVSEYMQLVRELDFDEVEGYLLYPAEEKLVRVA
jgi:ATP-dependent exoDNAse (exonuclease V) beta subunit